VTEKNKLLNLNKKASLKSNIQISKQVLINELSKRLSSNIYYTDLAKSRWSSLIKNLMPEFNLYQKSFSSVLLSFSRFFYKKIRTLQSFIKMLKFKIFDLHNLKLLQNVSEDVFYKSFNNISIFDVPQCSPLFKKKLSKLFPTEKEKSTLDIFLDIQNCFAINIEYKKEDIDEDFNLYLFQLYLNLYELESCMQ